MKTKDIMTTEEECWDILTRLNATLDELDDFDLADERPETIIEWIESAALDVEYTINSTGAFLGATIAITIGGPYVAIDTRHARGIVSWGFERVTGGLNPHAVGIIHDYFEDIYNATRD